MTMQLNTGNQPFLPEKARLDDVEPSKLKLGDLPVDISTADGLYICTITLSRKGIRLSNKESKMFMDFAITPQLFIGTDTMPNGFFGSNVNNISRKHFTLEIYGRNSDGSIKIGLINLSKAHGTLYELGDIPRMLLQKDTPVSTGHLVANGAEDSIETPDGNCTARTDLGKTTKAANEDAVYVDKDFIAVADGMGGAADGSFAAYCTLMGVMRAKNKKIPVRDMPAHAVEVLEEQQLPKGSGATLAIAKKTPHGNAETKIEACTVGDAKVYVISKSQRRLVYTSKDQSLVQAHLDAKILNDPLDRYTSQYSNVVLNAVTAQDVADPEYISLIRPIGDTIVVACSDGVSDFVSPDEILELALKYGNLAGDKIAEFALSRQRSAQGFVIRLGKKMRHAAVNHGDNTSVAVMMA